MSDEDGLLPILIFLLLTMMEMLVTSPDQELPPMSLSRVMRIAIVSIEIIAHLAKAWEMTL